LVPEEVLHRRAGVLASRPPAAVVIQGLRLAQPDAEVEAAVDGLRLRLGSPGGGETHGDDDCPDVVLFSHFVFLRDQPKRAAAATVANGTRRGAGGSGIRGPTRAALLRIRN